MALKAMSDDQVEAAFGKPVLKELPGNQFKITNGWDRKNLGTLLVPQLVGVPGDGFRFTGRLTFHKLGTPQLLAGFEGVELAGHLPKILSFSGSFNPRKIRGSNRVSRHTFATAFDINADENPFHRPVAARGKKGSLHEVAEVLDRFGFAWGGNFSNPDGMHFEIGKLLTKQECEEILQKEFGLGPEGMQVIVAGVPQDVRVTLRENMAFARLKSLLATIGQTAPAEMDNPLVSVDQFFKGNGFDVTFEKAEGTRGAIVAVPAAA
ncbi:MAG TPA: M15 family metallopeptidase [Thermoanaerobaculia bacterium]|nr:M15 family metallopeptidase [Thermoanaerobaculia bacterium]